MGRMIDGPAMFGDEDLGALPAEAGLLFVAYITFADDEGRGQDDPRFWKRQVFALRPASLPDIRGWSEALGQWRQDKPPMVIRYSVPGLGRLYQVSRWRRWQRIRKPMPSVFPPPPDWIQDVERGRRGPAPAAATDKQAALIGTLAAERGLTLDEAYALAALRPEGLTAKDADLLIRKLIATPPRERAAYQENVDAVAAAMKEGSGTAVEAEISMALVKLDGREWDAFVRGVMKGIGKSGDAYVRVDETTIRPLRATELVEHCRGAMKGALT